MALVLLNVLSLGAVASSKIVTATTLRSIPTLESSGSLSPHHQRFSRESSGLVAVEVLLTVDRECRF